MGKIRDFLFSDLPRIVDSAWRHAEYSANRNHIHDPARGTMARRPRHRTLGFAFLTITVAFLIYGPTLTALCSLGSPWIHRAVTVLLATVPGLGAIWLTHRLLDRPRGWRLVRLAPAFVPAIFVTVMLPRIMLGTSGCMPGVPTPFAWPALLQAVLVVLAPLVVAVLAARYEAVWRRWPVVQTVLLWLVAAAVWLALADETTREADQLPYRHALVVLTAILFVLPLLAEALAHWFFDGLHGSGHEQKLREALAKTELFMNRDHPPRPTAIRIWHAFINGPVNYPLQLLLLPGLAAVAVPDDWLWAGAATALAAGWLLLTWGSISARWSDMVTQVDRWFLTGTPQAISLLVIGAGVANIFGVDYVATVLASAPFGIVFAWITMLYVLFWVLEYAINEPLGAALLRILQSTPAAAEDDHGFVAYPFNNPDAWNLTRVASDKRYLAQHGAGRFAVVGAFRDKDGGSGTAFHTYGFTELFLALAQVDTNPAPGSPRPHPAEVLGAASEVNRRVKLYFDVLNVAIVAVLALAACYVTSFDRTHAARAVVSASATATGGFDLAAALAQRQAPIVVAASGGGTRAALYTEEVLKGLARLGVADDIVLASGVSGGGVALAYFAAHRQALLTAPDAWQAFRERMTDPFIKDVLAGAMEWRIAGAAPLSMLLAESLDRRLGSGITLGALEEFGLLLNTTVAGHPRADSLLVSQLVAGDGDARPYAHLAGARLAFTNLKAASLGRPGEKGAPDLRFPFTTVADPTVPLFHAAALNANFPPVFPNARVDLTGRDGGGQRSYYVTDGGVVENLGLLSALYAVRGALERIEQNQRPKVLHLLAIEASAMDLDYSQNRALGALATGKERIAGGLTAELLADVQTLLHPGVLQLHYLPMPLALTSRGGIGTHWQLPPTVTLNDPRTPAPPALSERFGRWLTRNKVELNKAGIYALLEALHGDPYTFCDRQWPDAGSGLSPAALAEVQGWICNRGGAGPGADPHLFAWEELVESLQ